MSLSLWLFSLAALLAAAGTCLLLATPPILSALRALPRSKPLAAATMLIGGAGFLWQVFQLGEADFGSYRLLIAGCAAFIGILAFWHAPDFLAVRGSVIVYFLAADAFLTAGFMRYEPLLLLAKAVVYLGIAIGIWWSISPFRARDCIEWLTAPGKPLRIRILGAASLLAAGLIALGGANLPGGS